MNKQMFTLLATIHIKPDCIEEFISLNNPVNDAMRHEPTFISFVMNQSIDNPGLFVLHEMWLDRENFFSVQMKRDYRQDYEARLPALLKKPREMNIFEPKRSDYVFRTGKDLSVMK